jgi:hypothetical protein
MAPPATCAYDHGVTEEQELDFALVGEFKAKTPSPDAPGLYAYEPYRSGDHHELQQRLRRGEAVRCKLAAADGSVVHFVVTACPDHGVLRVGPGGR